MEANVVTQFSLVSAVWEGVGSSGLTISNVSDKGDHGLGTFQHLDGEVVMVDGQVYQFRPSGSVSRKGDEDIVTFAQVVFFKPNSHLQFDSLNPRAVLDYLDTSHPGSHNLFHAVKIEGMFRNIKLHVARRQQYQGEPGSEIMKSMLVYDLEDIEGIAFGFRSPQSTLLQDGTIDSWIVPPPCFFGSEIWRTCDGVLYGRWDNLK
ncbi:hypothetical protein FOVSG1_007209 [Fusarium oxysporum f. sp. vasinfectum]